MTTGKELKDDGIERVLSNEEHWSPRVIGAYRGYMATRASFTAEECRLHALANGITPPHHPNAWGGVWNTVARSGAIRKTGEYVKTRDPSNHACEVPVWEKTEAF